MARWLVGLRVDRFRGQERFVESIELLLNRSCVAFRISRVAPDVRFPLLPRAKDEFFHQAYIAEWECVLEMYVAGGQPIAVQMNERSTAVMPYRHCTNLAGTLE